MISNPTTVINMCMINERELCIYDITMKKVLNLSRIPWFFNIYLVLTRCVLLFRDMSHDFLGYLIGSPKYVAITILILNSLSTHYGLVA